MDRFDLECHIMNMHSIVDDLNNISYGVLEEQMTEDEITNALHGLAVMTEIKIKKLFNVFTQVFKLDDYNNGEF
jgi:hypothetical protein